MPKPKKPVLTPIREWTLPAAATLGSSVRAKGILLEIRARLPGPFKKFLEVRGAVLVLSWPENAEGDAKPVVAIIEKTLDGIETMPVIPREIQDILAITTTERHRWLKDGRLHSAGTRTVKLRGRARKITFHVFDPRHVEDVLDRDLVSHWREDDVIQRAENRRLATAQRALMRKPKSVAPAEPKPDDSPEDAVRHQLKGWAEFERDGFLR